MTEREPRVLLTSCEFETEEERVVCVCVCVCVCEGTFSVYACDSVCFSHLAALMRVCLQDVKNNVVLMSTGLCMLLAAYVKCEECECEPERESVRVYVREFAEESVCVFESVYVCVCVCVCVYIGVSVSVCACVYIYMCVSECVCACLCVYKYLCMSSSMSVCVYEHV